MTHAQQIHPLAGMIGTELAGTYRLDALIGEGGMGAVFRGHHLGLGRDFAIKVLHPDYSSEPELVQRFDREAHSAARLNHPNCVGVTEFGTTGDGTRYIVMELLTGVELQQILDGPLAPRRAVDLILQIVRGLEHAHAQGVVHRDLKLQNIFVTRDADGYEQLKLLDFGIAKIIHGAGAHDQMTRGGMVFGTPQYMSPEQALGMDIDARADLYAVGVLLYALVAGRLPFDSEDLLALIRMQVSSDPPPLPDAVPHDLAAIIRRLLAKQREQRFPDAGALRVALERHRDAWSSGSDRDDPGPDPDPSQTDVSMPLPDALRPRTLSLTATVIDRAFLDRLSVLRIALVGGLLVVGGVLVAWLL
jgi:serine/threonine protein kinase